MCILNYKHKVRQEEIWHLIHDVMLKAEHLNDPSHNSNLEIWPESFKLQAHARSSNFYKAYPCTLVYYNIKQVACLRYGLWSSIIPLLLLSGIWISIILKLDQEPFIRPLPNLPLLLLSGHNTIILKYNTGSLLKAWPSGFPSPPLLLLSGKWVHNFCKIYLSFWIWKVFSTSRNFNVLLGLAIRAI